MKNKKILFLLIVLLIAVIIFGIYFLIGFKSKYSAGNNKKNIYQEKLALAGELLEIKNNILVLKINNNASPNPDKKSDLYEIGINKNTEVIRYLKDIKSKNDFMAEQVEYEMTVIKYKNNNKSTFGLLAPNWNVSEKILLNELQKGDLIEIIAEYNDVAYVAKYITIKDNSEPTDNATDKQKISEEYEGVIDSVDKVNKIINFNYFGDIKEIKYDSSSEYLLKTIKTVERFKKEQKEYNLAIKNKQDHGNLVAPSWFDVIKITIDDLKSGQTAYVYVELKDEAICLNELQITN